MAETERVVDQTEEQAAASFAAGFDDALPADTATAQGSGTASQQPEQPETPPADEYVQVTRKDFDKLMAAAEKVGTIGPQFDRVFGTIGNLQQQQQQLIGRLQSETPRGASVKIDDEDFAELKENFPELAGQTKAALERIFKKANLVGTGTPATAPVFDDYKVRETWRTQRIREELEELTDLHPDWQDIVGRPEDAGNGFRQWLASQPEDYQNRVSNTTSARVTARAIDRFLETRQQPARAATTAPRTMASTRRERMQDAVQPTGTGTRPAPQRATAEDEFRSGFLNG